MSNNHSFKIDNSFPGFVYLYIASWKGSADASSNNAGVNPNLSAMITKHLGASSASLFASDFINYQAGYILCVNTQSYLDKFFNSISDNNAAFLGISSSLKFTAVKMPEEFVNNKSKLSSPYSYGEKIKVNFASEKVSESDKVQSQRNDAVPHSTSISTSKIFTSKILVYRDSNMKGRSRSGGGTTSAGVGVWS